MKTPKNKAGGITEQILQRVKARKPGLDAKDYNRMFETAYQVIDDEFNHVVLTDYQSAAKKLSALIVLRFRSKYRDRDKTNERILKAASYEILEFFIYVQPTQP